MQTSSVWSMMIARQWSISSAHFDAAYLLESALRFHVPVFQEGPHDGPASAASALEKHSTAVFTFVGSASKAVRLSTSLNYRLFQSKVATGPSGDLPGSGFNRPSGLTRTGSTRLVKPGALGFTTLDSDAAIYHDRPEALQLLHY